MSQPQQQNYANHKQIVPLIHQFMLPLSIIAALASIVYAIMSIAQGGPIFISLLLLVSAVLMVLSIITTRSSAIRVQDRLIRTEEDLRHFKLTGRWLDARITYKQAIALRFASDAEFPALCEKAANKNMAPDAIKRAVKDWKGDHFRV
ncbi:DUF6526 family protein [Paenibacillus thalictri]|uniref:ABC transporter permease n=1 Tax=Paenibacillus thalictri TaxID=2527873 RepID=A0A4Q9DWJ2_9BACL|nr:DUF6526 family protein [Paenibacillus thalictri]TBL80202.1 hypothetical protein EYB31_07210 [Paenibacillus thalictri]